MSTSLRPQSYRQPVVVPAENDPFQDGLREIAQDAQRSVPDLTAREREWLQDMARKECRYPMPTVRKLCAILRRSRNAEHRELFAQLIRNECSSGAIAVPAAFDLECPKPGRADVSQRAFEKNPNPITAAACRRDLEAQLVTTQIALDAVSNWTPGGAA